jgi:hypothetical protein
MTLAELHSIIKALEKRDMLMWNHTAAMMSLYYNSIKGKGGKQLSHEDFNPYLVMESNKGEGLKRIETKADVDKLLKRLENF